MIDRLGSLLSCFVQGVLENQEDGALRSVADEFKQLCGLPNQTSDGQAQPAIAARAAELIGSVPGQWAGVLRRVATSLDHPRRSRGEGLSVSELLLLQLLVTYRDHRAAFFQSIDDWGIFYSLGRLLPRLELSAVEVSALAARCAAFRGGDMASPIETRQFTLWASAHQLQAQELVASWLDTARPQRPFPVTLLVPFIEGVLSQDSVLNPVQLQWKDALLHRMARSPDEDLQCALVYLACFAWPQCASAEARHEALLEAARPGPVRYARAVFAALNRDAGQAPELALNSLDRFMRLVNEAAPNAESLQRVLVGAADTTWRAVAGLPLNTTLPETAQRMLTTIVDAQPIRNENFVDRIASELFTRDVPKCEAFVQAWIRAHAMDLLRLDLRPSELLPCLIAKASKGWLDTRLVQWIVDHDEGLRCYAARLGLTDRGVALDATAFASLAKNQALSLIHTAAAASLPGPTLLNVIVRAFNSRSDVLPLAREVLATETLLDYPGVVLDWVAAVEQNAQSAGPHDNEVASDLRVRLAARDLEWKTRESVPELAALCPTRAVWLEEQRAHFDQAIADANEQSFAFQLATRIPIARGNTHVGPYQADPTPFVHQEFKTELPVTEPLDLVRARFMRNQHAQAAERLLQKPANEERT